MAFTRSSRRKATATKRGKSSLSFSAIARLGEEAYAKCYRPEDCPYDPSSDEADAWLFGWEGAMDDLK